MKILKRILRILMLPVCLVFLLIQLIFKLSKSCTSWLLSLLSLVLVITGIFVMFAENTISGMAVLLLAWAVSPYGLILLADTVIDHMTELMYKIRAGLA